MPTKSVHVPERQGRDWHPVPSEWQPQVCFVQQRLPEGGRLVRRDPDAAANATADTTSDTTSDTYTACTDAVATSPNTARLQLRRRWVGLPHLRSRQPRPVQGPCYWLVRGLPIQGARVCRQATRLLCRCDADAATRWADTRAAYARATGSDPSVDDSRHKCTVRHHRDG